MYYYYLASNSNFSAPRIPYPFKNMGNPKQPVTDRMLIMTLWYLSVYSEYTCKTVAEFSLRVCHLRCLYKDMNVSKDHTVDVGASIDLATILQNDSFRTIAQSCDDTDSDTTSEVSGCAFVAQSGLEEPDNHFCTVLDLSCIRHGVASITYDEAVCFLIVTYLLSAILYHMRCVCSMHYKPQAGLEEPRSSMFQSKVIPLKVVLSFIVGSFLGSVVGDRIFTLLTLLGVGDIVYSVALSSGYFDPKFKPHSGIEDSVPVESDVAPESTSSPSKVSVHGAQISGGAVVTTRDNTPTVQKANDAVFLDINTQTLAASGGQKFFRCVRHQPQK